jgi:hypothetical protein
MKAVAAGALGLGCAVFLTLALGAIAAFGPAVNANILNNLSATGMAPLIGSGPAQVRWWVSDAAGCCHVGLGGVGPKPARTERNLLCHHLHANNTQLLSGLVRGGFLVSLLGSFALLMFPLRTCLVELLWGKTLASKQGPAKAAAAADIEAANYVPLTYGILASTIATAVLVPDIWAALSIVGDLASTMQVRVICVVMASSLWAAACAHTSSAQTLPACRRLSSRVCWAWH